MLKYRLGLIMLIMTIMGMVISGSVYLAGLTLSSGHAFNINTSTMNISGEVNNDGVPELNSGEIFLNGNWSNTDSFISSTGAVTFNSISNEQLVTTGGIGSAFNVINILNTHSLGASFIDTLYCDTLNATSVNYLNVSYSQESVGNVILACNSIDGGSNTNWGFNYFSDPYIDDDRDLYTENQGDCNDNDPLIYPGAREICNGEDNDCNGIIDDKDFDIDGFIDVACGGDDCDDTHFLVNPGMSDVHDNGIDDDCNPATVDNSEDQAYIDLINDPSETSSDLKSALNDASPLSEDVLNAAILRNLPMDTSDLKDVLLNDSLLNVSVLRVLWTKTHQ